MPRSDPSWTLKRIKPPSVELILSERDKGFEEWPAIPSQISLLTKAEASSYIYAVLSHLLETNFQLLCGPKVMKAARNYLPDWAKNPKDLHGHSLEMQRKIITYMIETFNNGEVKIEPLTLDFQKIESVMPKEAEIKSIPGTPMNRFINFYKSHKSLLANIFSCKNIDSSLVRADDFRDYYTFVRWYIKSIVGKDGEKFLRSMDNALEKIEAKEIRSKDMCTRHLQKISITLNMDQLKHSTQFADQQLVNGLFILYRYRAVAMKIGHVGWTGKEIAQKLDWKPKGGVIKWPQLYRPVEKMNPQEVRSYLLRTFMFLDRGHERWRTDIFGQESQICGNVYDNDASTNQRILKKLFEWRGLRLEDEVDLHQVFWPPLPKRLEDMNFIETAVYVQLLVLHLSGYNPNIADPNDKPCYWDNSWGLPLNTTCLDQWNDEWKRILGGEAKGDDHIDSWSKLQKTCIEQIADCYANPSWKEPDAKRYLACMGRDFPYLGRHYQYDYIALKRFRYYAEIYSPNKERVKQKSVIVDLFSRFPCLPITPKDLYLTIPDIRGFVLELVFHLLGFRPFWIEDSERPEFWPESLPWAHPFSSVFSSLDMLNLFVELLVKFAPKTLSVLPKLVDGYDTANPFYTGWNSFDGYNQTPASKPEGWKPCDFERLSVTRDALALELQELARTGKDFKENHREKKTRIKLSEGVLGRFSRKTKTEKPASILLSTGELSEYEVLNVDNLNSQELREYARCFREVLQRMRKNSEEMEDSELREFLSNYAKYGSTVSVTPVEGKIYWPPFPCQDWLAGSGGKQFNPDYLVCLTRALLHNTAPTFNKPESKPAFWPSWAKWTPVRDMTPTLARRIVTFLLEKFCVDPNSVPVSEFEFECLRTHFGIHSYLKERLKIPKSVNSTKAILSLYYEDRSYLLCLPPDLNRPLKTYTREDSKFYMYALLHHMSTVLSETAMAPFKSYMISAKNSGHNPNSEVVKSNEFFELNPSVTNETATMGQALRRIAKFAKKIGHIPQTSLPCKEVAHCAQWPSLPGGSLDKLEDFEVTNYLRRLIVYLGDGTPSWSKPPFPQWPSWATWRDPRENDAKTNKDIILQLMAEFDVTQLPCSLKKFWPPLPKELDQLSFPDVGGYITVLTFHLDGFKPDLAKDSDKPSFWEGDWGLPQPFDWTLPPGWAKDWVSKQLKELKSIFSRYNQSFHVDLNGYLPHYFRCFPFMGKFGELDQVAQKRLTRQKQNPESPEDKIQLPIWPRLELAVRGSKVFHETNLRGFLLETIVHLCGRHVDWLRSDHRPEFWPRDIPWQHPFALDLALTSVLRVICVCLKQFAPDYIGITNDGEYKTVMGEDIGADDHYLREFSHGILMRKARFLNKCEELAAGNGDGGGDDDESDNATTTSPNGPFTLAFKLTCRHCAWLDPEGKRSKTHLRFILDHLRTHHSGAAICEICSKTYASTFHLENHLKNTHHNTFREACTVCGKIIFGSRRAMNKHLLVHEPPSVQCSQCPKMFRYVSNLKIHEKYHLEVRPYRCDDCDQGFARKQHYQRHMLQKHQKKVEEQDERRV